MNKTASMPESLASTLRVQASWPTERAEVIKAAVRADRGVWPDMLAGGVMFYMGERITRAEFERMSKSMR